MTYGSKSDTVGQMRHRIEIIDLTQTIDTDYGGEALTGTTTIDTVWAAWEEKAIGSGEQVQSGALDQVNSVNFRIRHRTDVKTDMLIKYENLYYDILSVLPDSHRVYLTIEARQRGESWDQTTT